MKTISNGFIDALKEIKQVDAIISYADRENTNYIITQNSEMLLTEAQDYLVTESAEVELDNGGIQNIAIYWNTDVLKSACKMLDLETSNDIPKGTELNVKVGLLVDGEFEYVDYGKFYTTEDSKYQMDTNTYTTTAYDAMVRFNINASENALNFEEGKTYTLKQYLDMICSKCGVLTQFNLVDNTNANIPLISNDPYSNDKNTTYRDIVDDIAECLGTNFIININNRMTNKEFKTTITQQDLDRINNIIARIITPTDDDYRKYDFNHDGIINISDYSTAVQIMNGSIPPFISQMTIDADILKDSNVYVGEKKDGIDGIQVYDGSAILNYVGSDNSVFIIKNNNIMNFASSQLLDYVLSKLQGFSYYTYNLDTFGIFALEPFDCFTATYKNTNYLLCSFHNDIHVSSGVSEEISYEFKEYDDVSEYEVSSDKNKLADAKIEIDKANGQIVLKANSDGNLVQVELNADANEGSEFNVKADNINFEGTNFNLTSENIKIHSDYLDIDNKGNITIYIKPKYNYTQNDITRIINILNETITPTEEDYDKYDFDNSGTITTFDLVQCQYFVNFNISYDNPGKLVFKGENINTGFHIKDGNDNTIAEFTYFDMLLNGIDGSQTRIQPGVITLKDSNGNTKTITATN